MTDFKINTDSLPPEVTIRTGEAAPNPPRPVKIEFSGKIESPRTWIETQKANFNPTRSHAEANMAQGTIVLYENAREKYSAVVAGTLKPCPIISEFGINSAKYYTPKDLAKKLRMSRHYFADPEECQKVVGELQAFKAKVKAEIEKSEDNRGNQRYLKEKAVESNAPESITLNLPTYDERNAHPFRVEIGVELHEDAVRMWLESPDLANAMEHDKYRLIDQESKAIEESGITVLYA